jgi:hypothetical protein
VLIERAFDAKLNGRMSPAIYANRENPRDPFHFPTLRRILPLTVDSQYGYADTIVSGRSKYEPEINVG